MKLYVLALLILVSINRFYCTHVRIDPLVLTAQGLVRGQRAPDGDYSTFLGIPYARVDPENLFGENVPPETISDIFNAYDGSSACPSITSSPGGMINQGNLDCLKLNIYVPSVASSTNLLPVLVWIHGGAYMSGSSSIYNARDLVRHDLILVTINYRLGPYGFMCLDVPTVPGNQGLKDQLSAFKWIKDNIAVFGGDSNNVTLAGQSSGGSSIDFHIFSSHERLYNKVIIQSGSAEGSLGHEKDERAAVKIATRLGFSTNDTNRALSYLNTVDPYLVVNAAIDLQITIRPCIERSFSGVQSFIETNAFSFFAPDKLRNIPILIGHTDKELPGPIQNTDINVFHDMVEHNYNLDEDSIIEAGNILRHFYIGDRSATEETDLEIGTFFSDYMFNHPIQRTITKYLEQGAPTVYQYVFSYVSRSSLQNVTNVGASHTAELQYLFNINNIQDLSEQDTIVTNRMTTMWANFVKHGNPTPQVTELLPITWEPVSVTTRPYLNISTDITLEYRVYNDRMAFWDLFFISYGKHHKLVQTCEQE